MSVCLPPSLFLSVSLSLLPAPVILSDVDFLRCPYRTMVATKNANNGLIQTVIDSRKSDFLSMDYLF